VVTELTKRGLLEKTDIFVVSDHGFSTCGRTVDTVKYFNDHGLSVSTKFIVKPQPGQVMSANVGGATGLYVIGHDPEVTAKLVQLLQASDFCGPIFTRAGLPGTFPLQQAHIDSPEEADIVYSFRWSAEANSNGTPGLITSDSNNKAGLGLHGALSPFDLHNTCVAAGPDIRAGYRNTNPSGNIDVAPTILHLLGLKQTAGSGSDGRVLAEAFADSELPTEQPVAKEVSVTQDLGGGLTWKQTLQTTEFGGKAYVDQGTAEAMGPAH
jgi:arylsulfatase A-like enzyme